MTSGQLALAAMLTVLITSVLDAEDFAGLICPQPQSASLAESLVLAERGGALALAWRGKEPPPPAVDEGRRLLARRLADIGARKTTMSVGAGAVTFTINADALKGLLKTAGARRSVSPAVLRQAYAVEVKADGGKASATVTAADGLGAYYAAVTLCQMVSADGSGRIVLPAGKIVDWPEIAHRLSKTSITFNKPDVVESFMAWMPLMKVNQGGIQFHGARSKQPDTNFTRNLERLLPAYSKRGTLDLIVYFCPFRGVRAKGSDGKRTGPKEGHYDFTSAEGRAAYGRLLRSFLAAGARGVQIDYNDWASDKGMPIADVLNLACDAIKGKYPDALVLYCPPMYGGQVYQGRASSAMRKTLSQAPAKVWPLWTGMHTVMTRPLKAEQVRAWTTKAGRKPFLWINRVSLGVNREFGRAVPAAAGAHVFRGEWLPTDLGQLVEGVHLNTGNSKGYNSLSKGWKPAAMAYLSTAADWLWNPARWKDAASARRAARFVKIMKPLLAQAGKPAKP